MLTSNQVIDALQLEKHIEGGYFKRTFQADHRGKINTAQGERFTLTSIFYLLTNTSPLGQWHKNLSDIVHYYHLGNPVEYSMIHPDGRLEQVVLGSDILAGQSLQLIVNGGVWKSSRLLKSDGIKDDCLKDAYDFGLVSEAVSPGFEFIDMSLGNTEALVAAFPQHKDIITRNSRKKAS